MGEITKPGMKLDGESMFVPMLNLELKANGNAHDVGCSPNSKD